MLNEMILLPSELSLSIAILLIVVSFFTSALTAAVGIGGGVALLAVLVSIAPPAIALPVHGIVQIGSNAGRAGLMRKHIRWDIFQPFAWGSLLGIIAGALVFVALPTATLQILLGVFILYSVWAPKLRPADIPLRGFALVGAVATFCTMFVGATGPMLAAFLSPVRFQRHNVVATHATCMTLQHSLKAVAFGFLGFNYWPWLVLLAAMIGSGFVGTMVGCHVLNKLPEQVFRRGFQIILTLLALRLLWSAWQGI